MLKPQYCSSGLYIRVALFQSFPIRIIIMGAFISCAYMCRYFPSKETYSSFSRSRILGVWSIFICQSKMCTLQSICTFSDYLIHKKRTFIYSTFFTITTHGYTDQHYRLLSSSPLRIGYLQDIVRSTKLFMKKQVSYNGFKTIIIILYLALRKSFSCFQ